jgi:sigma-B regulation protein RsbU (phosphoserine phosphatase)
MFPEWFGANHVNWPFQLYSEEQPHFLIHFVFGDARTAGLLDGDLLIAINGIPVTSRSIYDDALIGSRPGDSMNVTFRKVGEQVDRHANLRLSNLEDNPILINSYSIKVLFYVAVPAFCLALGFWVAAFRLHDLRAWLLLGLLLSIATFFNAFPEFWSPPFRTLGAIYLNFQEYSLFGWLLLLGVYFPEPFPTTLRWKWWKWLAWTLLPLWAAFAVAYIVDLVIQFHSLAAALPLYTFLGQTLGSRPAQILPLLMILGFLACFAAKYRTASSADAKRRLRVLYAGAAISLLPITILLTIGNLKGTDDAPFPIWLKVVVFLAFFLFPVTLAYAIVVQRALDIRVVLRQGLQYTLARRGVLILQILLSAALFIALTILMTSHAMNPLGTVAALAVGFWGIFVLHGATQRLAVWVDRRFFRDAYDAEQILNDLAENVRTIVETQPLLETVARRIADSLHVKQIAVLLDRNGPYLPAHAVGFDTLPELAFSPNAVRAVPQNRKAAHPSRLRRSRFVDLQDHLARSSHG